MRLIYERNLSDRSCVIPRSNAALLFRKQVSRVMSTPVLTCREDDPVCDAARQMIAPAGGMPGGRGCRRPVPAGCLPSATWWAAWWPSRPARWTTAPLPALWIRAWCAIAPEAYLGEALAAMIRDRTRQLVVMERDLPVGVVAFSDLVRSPSADSLMLIHEIADQNSLDGLAALSAGIDRVLDALVAERAGVQETMEIMSRLNNRITRKVIALCEVQMKTDGWGPPPVDYCWINMGSAARHEQTLRTDQDNAIIYGDPEGSDAQATVDYFTRLAVTGCRRAGPLRI
jgi:CBS domain-containing protein